MNSPEKTIYLNVLAPRKPAEGDVCNGCGVCCALETCPIARIRYLRANGPCPALQWLAGERRYQCGFLVCPDAYFPSWLVPLARIGVARAIAAGKGCDCSVEYSA